MGGTIEENIKKISLGDVIVDWSQFIPTLISTCVGCTLAIFFTSIYDKRNIRRERNNIKDNIISELDCVKKTICDIQRKGMDAVYYYIEPVSTPVFDAWIYGQKMELLFQCKEFKSQDSKNNVFLFYDLINEYNRWHTWRTNHKHKFEDIKIADNHIAELEMRITDIITKIEEDLHRRQK